MVIPLAVNDAKLEPGSLTPGAMLGTTPETVRSVTTSTRAVFSGDKEDRVHHSA